MDYKMTNEEKHTCMCSQEETIRRLNYFLVGNGNPQDGILFKFERFMSEHSVLLDDIKDIKDKVEELHDRADENKESAAAAMRTIERYKLEEDRFAAGREETKRAEKLKRNLIISRVSTLVAIVISIFMAWLGYRSLMMQAKATEAETKATNAILAPDSTEATVSIRGNVYIPVLKTDSANIIHANKLEDMVDKYLENQ
jgi:hypothetical protein